MGAAPLERWVAPLVTQPLSRPVPADDAAYRRRKGDLRLAVRAWRRALQLRTSGQAALRRERFDPVWRRVLWIHEEAPQIGDALMDLAPRSLLAERGIAADLLAPPTIAALFDGDRWLRHCFSAPESIDPARYDAVIASSDGHRALATKRSCAPAVPWISIAGAYNAPDYQRAMFGAQRFADLLDHRLSVAEMCWHARQKLDRTGRYPPAQADDPERGTGVESTRARLDRSERHVGEPRVAIACGGVRDARTYRRWPDVVASLAATGIRSFVAVGSANGRRAADAIAGVLPPAAVLDDRVGQGDLHAARAAIGHCDLLVCADGGLLHLGLTTAVPIVALFTSTIDPAWRLPPDFDGVALRSHSTDVDGIPPERVADAVGAALRARPD